MIENDDVCVQIEETLILVISERKLISEAKLKNPMFFECT